MEGDEGGLGDGTDQDENDGGGHGPRAGPVTRAGACSRMAEIR